VSSWAAVPARAVWAPPVFVTQLSIGEAIWSPRWYDYSMSVAPEGKEGVFTALASAPLFLASLPTGQSSLQQRSLCVRRWQAGAMLCMPSCTTLHPQCFFRDLSAMLSVGPSIGSARLLLLLLALATFDTMLRLPTCPMLTVYVWWSAARWLLPAGLASIPFVLSGGRHDSSLGCLGSQGSMPVPVPAPDKVI
jgi:hypothetical protein